MTGPTRPAAFDSGGSPFVQIDETLVHQGAVVGFYEGSFRELDGGEPTGAILRRDIIRHPGAVSAIAVEDDHVFLVRQYRAPVDTDLWEIPAGKLDIEGEPPEETVVRELIEEIGRRPAHIEPLLLFHHSPGFCDELQHIFLATDLEAVPRQTDGPEEAHMLVEKVPFALAVEMACDGTITDGKSIAGILAAARRLGH